MSWLLTCTTRLSRCQCVELYFCAKRVFDGVEYSFSSFVVKNAWFECCCNKQYAKWSLIVVTDRMIRLIISTFKLFGIFFGIHNENIRSFGNAHYRLHSIEQRCVAAGKALQTKILYRRPSFSLNPSRHCRFSVVHLFTVYNATSNDMEEISDMSA